MEKVGFEGCVVRGAWCVDGLFMIRQIRQISRDAVKLTWYRLQISVFGIP